MPKEKTVTINGEHVACQDVLQVRLVCVSNTLQREIKYRKMDPCYHEVTVLVPKEEGYKIELAIRKKRPR
jgi:hypothetical protein